MIEKIDREDLKRIYGEFRKSEDYNNRKSQLRFSEIARLIIKELLKKEEISNEDLTGLIQMFGAGCKSDNFLKHLKVLGLSRQKEENIYQMFMNTKECGYTGRGKAAIQGLNKNQLKAVKVLLKSILEAETIPHVKEVVSRYEDMNIPQVTTGIYSPWLYYIKPTICPIVAGPASQFLYALGWDEYYVTAIDFFQEINKIINEVDLGFIDAFLWHGRWKQIIINGAYVKNQNNQYKFILRKKQIILYGPPGTGKTYNTKRFAVGLIRNG